MYIRCLEVKIIIIEDRDHWRMRKKTPTRKAKEKSETENKKEMKIIYI